MSFQCLKTLQAEVKEICLTDLVDFSDIDNKTLLNLSNQDLSILNKLPFSCQCIKNLNISHNKLKNLAGLSQFTSLTQINLSHNQISSLSELANIKNKKNLLKLFIKANPCLRNPNFLPIILKFFPKLTKIDDIEVTDNIKQDVFDGFRLEKKIIKYFVQTFKIIQGLEQGVKRVKVEYELLQACKWKISPESGPYWEDINARHLKELKKMMKIPKMPCFWTGCEIRPCVINDFIDFVSKSLGFYVDEMGNEKNVFEWVFKQVLLKLHKWGLHSLQLYLQENLGKVEGCQEIDVFKDMKIGEFKEFGEGENRPRKILDPVKSDCKFKKWCGEWQIFPVFSCDKGYLKALFELVQEQIIRIEELQREKEELLSFDCSSIGIPSFADNFCEIPENVLKAETAKIKKPEKNFVESKNPEKFSNTNKSSLEHTENYNINPQSIANTELPNPKTMQDLEKPNKISKKTLQTLTKVLESSLHPRIQSIFHQILQSSSKKHLKQKNTEKSLNHFKLILIKKCFNPLRYFYILYKTKLIKSIDYYNGRLVLDSFYALRNSAAKRKHRRKKAAQIKEAKHQEKLQQEQISQQKYESLINRVTKNKKNIQKIWKILNNENLNPTKCDCGGFKCPTCTAEKIEYIKKELKFLKKKMINPKTLQIQ